jgi:hypothetical protein
VAGQSHPFVMRKINYIETIDGTKFIYDLWYKYDENDYLYDPMNRPCNIKQLKDGSYLIHDYSFGNQYTWRIYPAGIKEINYVHY